MSEPQPWEGAGIASSVADVASAVDDGDVVGIAMTGLGLALDTMDFVGDPVGELLSAGFGWLVEHVWWLREPLDQLAGDPAAIVAAAEGWVRAARLLEVEAAALAPVSTWRGAAAEGFAAAEGRLAVHLRDSAAECLAVAEQVVRSGVAVGTVRAVIRDAIADFLAAAVQWLVATLLTSGLGLPVLITHVVREGLTLARGLLGHLDRLLGELAAEAGEILTRSTSMAELLNRTVEAGVGWGARGTLAAEEVAHDAVVEWGKQTTAAP